MMPNNNETFSHRHCKCRLGRERERGGNNHQQRRSQSSHSHFSRLVAKPTRRIFFFVFNQFQVNLVFDNTVQKYHDGGS